jgi:hypothetical protein
MLDKAMTICYTLIIKKIRKEQKMKKTYEVKIEDGINGADESITFVSSKPTFEVFETAIEKAIDASLKKYKTKFSKTVNYDDMKVPYVYSKEVKQGFIFTEFKVFIKEILMLHMTLKYSK